jgi:pimeloyl-ACP methyl ester carboxylesterase
VDGAAAETSSWSRRTTTVQGRVARYGTAGTGSPVVFLHGWGIDDRAYGPALRGLVSAGVRVVAPALPGFGGTPALPGERRSFAGYAEWLDELLDAVGVDEPAVIIGHSFGGGVAIVFAHDHPTRARGLVLVNSVGGSAWKKGSTLRSMAERPLWDWGLHLSRDLLPLRQLTRVLPVIATEAVPSVVRDPLAFWRAARIARTADLTAELEGLRDRGLPVVVLWGTRDRVIPEASTDALCEALDVRPTTLRAGHLWLIAEPDRFSEVMTNVFRVVSERTPRRRWWPFGRDRGRVAGEQPRVV